MIASMERCDPVDPYEPPYQGTTTSSSFVYLSPTDTGPIFAESEIKKVVRKQTDSRRKHIVAIPRSSFSKAKKRARNRSR